MRAVVQRVLEARVRVGERVVGEIGPGLLVLVGVGRDDGPEDVTYLAGKLPNLRLFKGGEGRDIDRSVVDAGGALLVVSQFTLFGDARGQRRPSFIDAALPDIAEPLVSRFVELLRGHGVPTQTGKFGAHMQVEIHNDGPVTIWLEK